MATSPIYGWLEPDNTDLVKNGALAIRTLGNAIDTTMGTMTPKSIVDAKGDLIAASANDTPARLAVGANGETLVADSSTATGLRYQGSQAAGKNALINGAADIWQRGTAAVTTNSQFISDRWITFIGSGPITWSQETSIVPLGARYSIKMLAGGAGASCFTQQVIETANSLQFAGQNATFSVEVASSAATNWTLVVSYSTGVDTAFAGSWTDITPTSGGTGSTSTTTFSRISGVFAIPSTAKSLKVYVSPSSMANTTAAYMSKAQLELGSVATSFARAGGSIQEELAACQRYYFRYTNSGAYEDFGFGNARSAAAGDFIVKTPVTMRTNPTSIDFSALVLLSNYSASPINVTGASLAAGRASTNCPIVYLEVASGLTTGESYYLLAGTGTSYIGFNSEL